MPIQLNARPLGKKHRSVRPEDRRREWLDLYEASKWIVRDSPGCGTEEYTIDFDVRMADGRSLLQYAELYASAKELLFWLRAGNYTRFDDAQRHVQYANTILRICYGLTIRGFYSFGALTSIDIDTICEGAAFGVDGLMGTSALVKKTLDQYHAWDQVPRELKAGKAFDEANVIRLLNLPPRWARKEISSEVEVASARINGRTLISVAALKEEPVTSQNIQLVTMCFEGMYALRDFIDATSIAFRPFPEGAAQRAFELGRASTRTPVPPPELAMRLLENTTRYFVEHTDHVLASYGKVIADRDSPAWSHSRAMEVGAQVRRIVTACYILIAVFTARRAEEIKMLRRDCIAGNDNDGWWIKVYIEKTERQWTWMPIPNLVARAFNTVRSLIPDSELDADANLFQYRDANGNIVGLTPESQLDTFADSVGAREYANDNAKQTDKWTWVTRQFRRLFAVLFFYRYRGKLQTLAHHLRHFDLRMTNDYVTLDPEVHKLWDQEVWHHQVEVAREIVDGRVTYKGPMGKRLTMLVKRLRDRFSDKLMVVSEAAGAALVRQIRKHQLVFTPKLWVTCTCPRNRNGCEKAACRKSAGYDSTDLGPDFSAAGPAVCPECPFALISPENIVYIEEQARAMAASAEVSAIYGNSMFARLQAANVMKITGFLNELQSA